MTATFITSTGTGIGKTFLTAGLVRYFREQEKNEEAVGKKEGVEVRKRFSLFFIL